MNIVVIKVFCIFIVSIYAEFNIIYKSPNITMSTDTHEFEIEINKEVNQPKFPAYIHIYKAMTSEVVYKIDVSANNSNITYVNKTLRFHIPDSNEWNIDKQYDIILDEGVLYSDNVLNSTAQTVSTFQLLKAVDNGNSSIGMTSDISSTITNIETTESFTSSSSDNVTEMSQPTTTLRQLVTGESPPTRSAQLGMGLGITFIGILLIGEIIYFKYFYRGGQ